MRSIVGTVAVAAVSVVLLAGCSDESSDMPMDTSSMGSRMSGQLQATADADARFGDADVTFASSMYPHHAQAVEMAAMVDGRSTNPDLVALAGEIENGQKPQLEQLASWLRAWNASVPSTDMGGMEGGDMGPRGNVDSGSADGMMSREDMNRLTSLSGTDFDREWLTQMIRHHEGAVGMADTELADGKNSDARAMAQNIVDTQNAEIDRMRLLLD